MAANKKGRQKPTRSFVIPYKKSKGQEAVRLYNRTGKKALEWQRLLIKDIMAINSDGLWVHTKFGLAVPRRNGKNEVVIMRELWALEHGEHGSHTAHRTKTATSSWERLCIAVRKAGYVEGVDFKTTNRTGMESVRFLKTGGRIDFSTRSSQGGLGEGFDLLVIDEAQEYTDDQETALTYTVSDSMNPQTILIGTPPTAVSKGTVFSDYRKLTLDGERDTSGWAEWSLIGVANVEDVVVRNKDLWYETNPSLGSILNERKVADEIRGDTTDFVIQRLGFWIQYNQKSAISRTEWEAQTWNFSQDDLEGPLFVGIKYGIDNTNVSLGIAVKTSDGIFVEDYDCRSIRDGNDWIISFLTNAKSVKKVVVDGANGQNNLAEEMKEAGLKKSMLVLPTVKEYIAANAAFTQMLDDRVLYHANQPALTQIVSNCERRNIGSNGGYGYKSLRDGVDITLMDAVILAAWICKETKVRKQRVKC